MFFINAEKYIFLFKNPFINILFYFERLFNI